MDYKEEDSGFGKVDHSKNSWDFHMEVSAMLSFHIQIHISYF